MRKRRKQFTAIFMAAAMLFTSVPYTAMAENQEAFELPEVIDEKDKEYTADLKLISYGDLDDLRKWDDSLGKFDESEEAQLKAYIEKNITAGVTKDYEKAHLIFDWIYSNVEYAYYVNQIPRIDPWDVFTDKVAVCGGYSNLYKAMLNCVGIPSVLVSGNTIYGAHVWNAVYADGRWFYSDSTWGGVYFDPGTKNFLVEHTPMKVQALTLETEDGILIGYDNGVAAIGVTKGQTEVEVPDYYEDMIINSVSIGLLGETYGVKKVSVGPYVSYIETQFTSNTLEAFEVSKDNYVYAARDGVLYTKDMSTLLVYPSAKKDAVFTLPKETQSFDAKDAFSNTYLTAIEVEAGNTKYSAYDGLLYDADQKELLMVPAGATKLSILGTAQISDYAFANVDTSKVTIYSEEGSPAQAYAKMYNIPFAAASDCDCKETKEVITKATTKENGQIVVMCKDCEEIIDTTILYAVDTVLLSQTEYMYDGTNKMPEVTLKDTNGTVIEKEHYDVMYPEGCAQPGTYYVLVNLKGDYYTGTLKGEYVIKGLANPFKDVAENDYFYHAVLWAVDKKITSGYSADVFAPHATCTRAEVVTFLWRAHGCPEPKTSENPFADVKEKAYYYKAVLWAVENKITSGYSESVFAPEDAVTRSQFVTLLYRSEGSPSYTTKNPFADVEDTMYYYDAILWAFENGITAGYQADQFAPDMGCTRCQVVSFLHRNR